MISYTSITKILVVLVISVIFYFSWLPKPDIGSASYFPKEIGKWVNEYGNLRTAVPFVILGIVLEIGFIKHIDKSKKRTIILCALFLTVSLAELGQLFLPNRHFDFMDVFFGLVGSAVGILTGILLKYFKRLKSFD